jgi:hypothetical protein
MVKKILFSPGRRLWRYCRKENQTVFSSMRGMENFSLKSLNSSIYCYYLNSKLLLL